jgi:hypothetical protein
MKMPNVGEVVTCVIKSFDGKTETADLIHVKEDDVTWRTADDLSEFNEMAWDVVSWSAKEPGSEPSKSD